MTLRQRLHIEDMSAGAGDDAGMDASTGILIDDRSREDVDRISRVASRSSSADPVAPRLPSFSGT